MMNKEEDYHDFESLDDLYIKKEVPAADNMAQSKISGSGNSNVDVHIQIDVDVKPIAFALLYSLFASNQLTETQFEHALKRLEEF
jgi:hypothetical protein